MSDRRPYPWGMNAQEYAHGWNAGVYYVKSKLMPGPFSHADLMKAEPDEDELYGAKLFTYFKVANLLFPGHFPQVVAYSTNRQYPIHYAGEEFNIPVHYLFTKEASVYDEHRFYSVDMMGLVNGKKKLACTDEVCQRHDEFHANHEGLVREFAHDLHTAGIYLPYNDRSDWCVNPLTGDIVFFEIDRLYVELIRKYMIQNQGGISEKDAERLKRYLSGLEKMEKAFPSLKPSR